MSAYLKRLHIDSVEEVGVDTTNTAYLERVDFVEIVDSDGNPWPNPWDKLTVVIKPQNNDGDTANIGDTITFTTALYTGGNPETTTYQHRFQTKDNAADNSWDNGPWTDYDGTQVTVVYTVTEPGRLRLQCQGRDSSVEPILQVNSFGRTVTIPYLEFGDISVTVNDIEYDQTVAPPLTVLMNDPMPVVVSITGDATPTYDWTARNDYPIMVGQQAASTVLTFPEVGPVTVTCTLTDPNTEEYNTSVIINYFVVDAL